jgi:GTP-binding protein LepA
MLEVTHTIPKRKMREQVLDQMELERERGITIKMQPVRMRYKKGSTEYVLNLIDTPGHIDFSYEVSRALKAVEGVVLLIDATQGIQAQTLTTLSMACELGLTVIPALSKVDSNLARIDEVKEEVAKLLNVEKSTIIETSGKTGYGVEVLLSAIIDRLSPPRESETSFRGLVFDFEYSNHRGVIVFMRVFDGEVRKGERLVFHASGEEFTALEVGVFKPEEVSKSELAYGEIGYVVTGIKKPGVASVGDTLVLLKQKVPALSGYKQPKPMVWASVFPESQDDFPLLRQALERLCLSDSSFSYEEETSGSLGRGYRCGFLGILHLEIITERLRREFNLTIIVTSPSVSYKVEYKDGRQEVAYSPSKFPDHGSFLKVSEPWVSVSIISPSEYLGAVLQLLHEHDAEIGDSESFGDGRTLLHAKMPLRELMRNFFDRLKSVSSGFASISYETEEMREADVARLDMHVAEEVVPALSRVVAKRRIQGEAEEAVEKLSKILPKQLFPTKIQGVSLGRILSSKTLPALRKDVTGHLYGGDVTRKRKLLEKQKRGKKRMLARGKVHIPQDVFLKMMKSG